MSSPTDTVSYMDTLRELSNALTPLLLKEEPTSRLIFIPRPRTVTSFTEDLIDLVIQTANIDTETLITVGSRQGGRILLFSTHVAASTAMALFPIEVTYRNNTHKFTAQPPPRPLEGVRVRVSGLPITCDNDTLRIVAAVIANNKEDVLHAEMLKTKAGNTIDRGIIRFKIVPSVLRKVEHSFIRIGSYHLRFHFLDDHECTKCNTRGHTHAQCDIKELSIPKAITEERTVSPPTAPNATSKSGQSNTAPSNNNKPRSNATPTAPPTQPPAARPQGQLTNASNKSQSILTIPTGKVSLTPTGTPSGTPDKEKKSEKEERVKRPGGGSLTNVTQKVKPSPPPKGGANASRGI